MKHSMPKFERQKRRLVLYVLLGELRPNWPPARRMIMACKALGLKPPKPARVIINRGIGATGGQSKRVEGIKTLSEHFRSLGPWIESCCAYHLEVFHEDDPLSYPPTCIQLKTASPLTDKKRETP
jgi:hypothetical protein